MDGKIYSGKMFASLGRKKNTTNLNIAFDQLFFMYLLRMYRKFPLHVISQKGISLLLDDSTIPKTYILHCHLSSSGVGPQTHDT